jgi:hypothetical protein
MQFLSISSYHKCVGLLLLWSVGGCGTEGGDTPEIMTHTLENTGYACVVDDGNDDTSTAGIQVTLADCLSGCASSLNASCEASVVDGSIVVTASGDYTVPTGGEVACPAVCIELVADCIVSGITEETTTLSYAGSDMPLDTPSPIGTCVPLDD